MPAEQAQDLIEQRRDWRHRMSMATPQFTTTLSLNEMESLIRRVVKEAVHEEFARVMR
jgi:hypothetical protein